MDPKYADAIALAISEALHKDETLSKAAIITKIAEALGIDSTKVKEMLADASKLTEESLPKIAEVVGTTVETFHNYKKKGEETAKPLNEQKIGLNAKLSEVFGDKSVLTEKLTELKKIIESNKDENSRTWVSEVVRKIVEVIPYAAAASDEKQVIETITAENKSIKEQITALESKLKAMEVDLKTSKGLSETLKKTLEKNQHGAGKGLHEQSGGDTDTTATESFSSFEETGLARIITN